MSFYVATTIVLNWLRLPLAQWVGLISVTVATAGVVLFWEDRKWPLGLFVAPRLALRDLAIGAAAGAAIVGVCVVLVDVTSELRHEPGRGFPWLELLTVFVPAVLHEELLFRGYAFQKMHRWNRWFALALVAFIFAALHARNANVTILGLTNIFLGGLLLGLAWERGRRLWLPIGIHLAWNLMAGPVTGHEVSGYVPAASLLVTRGDGPWWVTGGEFGVEGSLWMTGLEVLVIGVLLKMNAERRTQN